MKEEIKKRPSPIVGALVINQERKILLAKSTRWNGYTVFGGHVEWNESAEESIRREVKEEAGIDIEIIDQIGFGEYIPQKNEKGHYAEKHMIFIDFVCLFNGSLDDIVLNQEFEKDSQVWVTLEEAFKLNLGGGTHVILERYQEYLKRESYLDDLKRLQADFENYKKRQLESQKDLRGILIEKLVLDIIPVLDNFRSATEHVPPEEKESPWVIGIQYIEKQLESVLTDNGMQTIEVQVGDMFDPSIHEALDSQQKTDNKKQEAESEKEQKIAKVVSKGYKFGERVIRAAKVTVVST